MDELNPVTVNVRYAAKAWIDAGSPQEGPLAEAYQEAFAAYMSVFHPKENPETC